MSAVTRWARRWDTIVLLGLVVYVAGVVYTRDNLSTAAADRFVVWGAFAVALLFLGAMAVVKHRRTGNWRRQFADPWAYAVYERGSIDEFDALHAVVVYVLFAVLVGIGVQLTFRLLDVLNVGLPSFLYTTFSTLVTIPLVLGIVVAVKWVINMGEPEP